MINKPSSPNSTLPSSPYRRPVTVWLSAVEGLQAVRISIYSATSSGLRLMGNENQFDADRHWVDEHAVNTRLPRHSVIGAGDRRTGGSFSSSGMLEAGLPPSLVSRPRSEEGDTDNRNPFGDSLFALAPDKQDPFDDSHRIDAKPEEAAVVVDKTGEERYHVFTKRQKWTVVVIIGVAGLFSGLSSNIYFPSLAAIAKDLGVSMNAVSLTITSYLVIQGISPVFWGAFSDSVGRRPIYIASFAVYIAANIGLSFSPNFAVLLIFRGLQAAGSASTVSIGNGVIQDISNANERGAFISFYQAIRNFSIAIGPVLGGLLAGGFGFRSIFVFLLIASSIVLLAIITFLPETMRSIAGDGSLRLSGVYQPLIRLITREPEYMQEPDAEHVRKRVTIMTFIEPLKLLAEKDILSNLVVGGVVYAVWSMVTASTTSLFKSAFGLSEALLGLAFLPNGFGTIVGSAMVGTLMTKDYRMAEEAYKQTHELPKGYKVPKNVPVDFPIERARLRHLPWIIGVFAVAVGAYGSSLAFPGLTARTGWIAVPLTLQFFIAAASNAVFALNQTLISDLCPGKGASATAINNLVRCSLGAVGVALVEGLTAVAGPGFGFLALAFMVVVMTPLAAVSWYWGPQWRRERSSRQG